MGMNANWMENSLWKIASISPCLGETLKTMSNATFKYMFVYLFIFTTPVSFSSKHTAAIR